MKKSLYNRATNFCQWFAKANTYTLLFCCMLSSIASASGLSDQTILEKKVTIVLKEVKLNQALQQIFYGAAVKFAYSGKIADNPQKVSVNVQNVSLRVVLQKVLPVGIVYEVINESVIIKAEQQEFKTISTIIDDIRIGGVVKDEKGELLPGVSVKIKGASQGTVTDVNGKYAINLPANATLVFSYIGFTEKEVKISGEKVLNVVLISDAKQLGEVVVVGYGTQTKAEFTGSAARVSGEALKDIPVQSFEQGLAGRASGLSIAQPNGVLNNAPVIRIRGVNSISLNSGPLIVVDGIPINSGNVADNATVANNPLGDINPADIASIDVLKDAASTSIYGSRAAGGVILITTKSGKTGKAKVTYEGWAGVTDAVRLPDMLNAEQFMMIKNEAVLNAKVLGGNANNAAVASALFFPTLAPDGSMVNTNWYDQVYQSGISQNHSLSISGGSESTKYYFSANYSNQEGILKTNEFSRKAARFNIDHKLTSWLSLTGSVNLNNTVNASPSTGSLEGNAFGLVGSARLAWLTAPNVYAINPDGGYNINIATNSMGMGNNLVQSNFYNPVPLLDLNEFTSENNRIIASFSANVNLAKGLSFKTYYALDQLKIENISFQNPLHGAGATSNGSAQNANRLINNWDWANTLNYQTKIAVKHNISALVGYDIQPTSTKSWGAVRTQLSDPFYTSYEGSFGAISPSNTFFGERALTSVFSRITYNYNAKYFFTLNYRRDGNSTLGSNIKYGDFGGVSGGWTLSEEGFYSESGLSDMMNSVKLRASWGKIGNATVPSSYPSLELYTSGLYGAVPTLGFNQASNVNLGWETGKQTNYGVDLGFLSSKITLEMTYFRNNVDGLILGVPQALSKGIPSDRILANVGSLFNNGFEVGLTANLINKAKFSWNTNVNFTTVKNRVTDLYGEGTELVGTTSTAAETTNITRVGFSVGSLFGAKTDGVNPQTGQRIFINKAGERIQYSHVVAPGTSRWTYLDGRPAQAISVNDYYLLGNALPTWYGGFVNNFKYGNMDVGINFTFSGGNSVMNGSKGTWRDQRFWNNYTDVLNRWTTPGQETAIPKVVYGDLLSNGSSFPISENVEKADFLRLQNASVGYRLPAKLFGKSGVASARIYTQVSNAFIITKYTGTDPEISVNGSTNTTPGVEKNSVPQGRTFTFGINVGF